MYDCMVNDNNNSIDKPVKYFDYPECKSWNVEEKEKISKRVEKYEKLVDANEGFFLQRQSAIIALKKAKKAEEALNNIYDVGVCGK
jgi:hypothetical protein